MQVNEDGSVLLTAEEHQALVEDQDFLDCLRNAGVDNWDGWDFACDAFHEMHPEED